MWALTFITVLAIFALAACGDKDDSGNNKNGSEVDLPEVNLDNIPDIVAEVNGEQITKNDFTGLYEQQFQQFIMQAQMTGQDLNDIDQDILKEQTVDLIVGQNLLMQEANKRVKEVSEDDINQTINLLVEQTGMESKDDLLAAFAEQGIDEKEFISQVETQVKVDQLIADISKDIKVTEEETKEAYDTLKAQQELLEGEEEFPPFDELKPALEEQIKDQKTGEEANSFVEELRKSAEITIFL